MKGLDIARGYFRDCAESLLDETFPEYRDRIAVGLAGEGSECFGFDDEISADHDFGPRFCIWITEEDEPAIGSRLREFYDSLPDEYMGLRKVREGHGAERSGVWTIPDFFKYILRREGFPTAVNEWLAIPDQSLAAAVNGEIFRDPLGDITELRRYLADCPEEVRLIKLSGRLFDMAQAGQYNYPRVLKRQDPVAAHLSMSRFIQAALMTVCALNRKYTPFYKWLYRAALDCELLSDTVKKIGRLPSCPETETVDLIESICDDVRKELYRQGLSDSPDTFLVAQADAVSARLQRR